MKEKIQLIVFGFTLAVSVLYFSEKFGSNLIEDAHADSRPCVTNVFNYTNSLTDWINDRYAEGYRVKGGGVGVDTSNNLVKQSVIMCR